MLCGRAAEAKAARLHDAWATRPLVVCTKDIDALPVFALHLLASVLSWRAGVQRCMA
jgi:hypothetical protein